MIVEWLPLIPLFVAMLAVSILPALPWALLLVRTKVSAIAISAPLTFGVLLLASILWPMLSIPWTLSTVLPLLALFALPGLVLLSRRVSVRALSIRPEVARAGLLYAAAVAGGWLIAAFPMLRQADPANPPQQWDSVFHLNGVWSMIHIHDGSPLSGLRELYGDRPIPYPALWHAFVALFSSEDTVIHAANVSSLVLMALWVLGAAGLLRTLTRDRSLICVGTLVTGALLTMPADALTMYNQWPHAMGASVVPGILILGVETGRKMRARIEEGPQGIAPFALLGAFVVAALGGAGAHPSSAFFVMAVLLPPYLFSCGSIALRMYQHGRIRMGLLVSNAGIAAIVTLLCLLATPHLAGMGRYPRSGLTWGHAFSALVSPAPPFERTWSFGLTIGLMGFLTIFGLGLVLWAGDVTEHLNGSQKDKSRPGLFPKWLAASLLSLALLTFLAYMPDTKIPLFGEDFELRSFLLSPWYKDPRRIMAIHSLMTVPFIASALVYAARILQELIIVPSDRRRMEEEEATRGKLKPLLRAWVWEATLIAFVFGVTGMAALDARLAATDYVYDPHKLGKPGMATAGELEMLRRMPRTLPRDAVVVGDPIAGEAYTEVIGRREAVFPQLTLSLPDSTSQRILSHHFKDIHTDPKVCEVVRKFKITHFYEDADGIYYTWNRSQRHPGFYGVDTSTGFELVDSGDQARLWKITACDHMG